MAQVENHLPTDITRDILSRLPVKSLLRFRCVSKPWCKLIDGQDFIKLHLNKSLTTYSKTSIILVGLGLYTVDLHTLDCAQELKPPFVCFGMSNSVNGLFLVVSDDYSPLIWNPSTRKHRVLPCSGVEYPYGCMPGSVYETYGFGYDAKNDDYKVVRSVKCRSFDFEWVNIEAKVFSMRSNSWRKIDIFPYALPHKTVWGVYVNGALHCHFCSPELILAFDFATERHFVIPNPNLLGDLSSVSMLGHLGGCLCLTNPRGMFVSDFWVMKEYGVKESWVRLFSLAHPLIGHCVSVVCPLAYSESGAEVLLNNDQERLVWYDLERKTMTNVQVRNLPYVFHAETYVGSLVSVNSHHARGNQDVVKKEKDRDTPIVKKTRKKRDDFLSEGFKLVL